MQKEYSNKFKALILTIYSAALAFLGYTVAPYVPVSPNPVETAIAPTSVVSPEVTVTATPSATIVPSKASSTSFTRPVAKPTL